MHSQSSLARSLPTGGRTERAVLIALAVLLAVQCVLGAAAALSEQSPFSEYLSQARRCVELNDCPSRGGRTGALPLFHGASWIRLLAYSLRSGHDLTWVQSVIFVTWMASIPLMLYLVVRYAGLRAAVLAMGLYFPVVLVGTDITDLTYTNLLPLPWALYYLGIALFIERDSLASAAVASVALAAAVSAELGCIVMVPFHFLLLVLTAPQRRVATVALCAAAFALAFCVDSFDAAREIARQVPTLRFAAGLAISGGVVLLAVRFSPRGLMPAALSAAERVGAVMAGALVYAVSTIWLANVLLMQGVPAPRYLVPAMFPFVFLVAERVAVLGTRTTIAVAVLESVAMLALHWAPRGLVVLQVGVAAIITVYAGALIIRFLRSRGAPGGLWPAFAVLACAVAVVVGETIVTAKRGGDERLTLGVVEPLVAKLYGDGYAYPELLGALQGPAADAMLALLTERDPHRFDPPPRVVAPPYSLLVIEASDAAIARTDGVVAAAPVGRDRSAIVVRAGPAYLDWLQARRCSSAPDRDGGSGDVCEQPSMDAPVPQNFPYVPYIESPPPSGDAHASPSAPGTIRFVVPVHTPGRGDAHVIRVTDLWPATWRITAVLGVDYEGSLPGPQVRLPDSREASGVIELEFASFEPHPPWVWIPPVVEVNERNRHLLDGLRSGRSPDA